MITDIFKEICDDLGIGFDHGVRSGGNIDRSALPGIYLYPEDGVDTFGPNNQIRTSYDCLFDIHDILQSGGVDASDAQIKAIHNSTELMIKRFLFRLKSRPEVKDIKEVRREKIYHLFADDLFGWAAHCKIELKETFSDCN